MITFLDNYYIHVIPELIIDYKKDGPKKTTIVNGKELIKFFDHPSYYFTKFLQHELQTFAGFTSDRIVVAKIITEEEIFLLIKKYLQMFKLCPKCLSNETHLFIEKNDLYLFCRECHHEGYIYDHPLKLFILDRDK